MYRENRIARTDIFGVDRFGVRTYQYQRFRTACSGLLGSGFIAVDLCSSEITATARLLAETSCPGAARVVAEMPLFDSPLPAGCTRTRTPLDY